jgi:tungstate transport system ATP-binding protein
MRALVTELPVVLDRVSARAGTMIIVDSVSLSIASGSPTLVVGPNGAGKSTLLRLCMGLLRPTEGRIMWGGRADPTPTRRAFVFQRPVMLRRTVAANVAYGLRHADHPHEKIAARTAQLLKRVGLSDLASRAARRLSGGEQQRLALARALARDPELLLLDEPTASLDPAATRSVEEIIRMAAESGIKIVMASHDLGQVKRLAGDVVFMLRGAVREQTSAATFFTNPTTEEAAAFVRGDLVV